MGSINWLSFIIAALIPMIIGFIYYHKALFGKAWMDSIGMTEEKAKEANMAIVFPISILMSAILAFFLLGFNNMPGQEGEFDTFKHGAFHGVFLSIVVVMPVMFTNGLFEQKSWKNLWINLGYWAITLSLMGGVIDAMHHWPNTM